MTTTRYLWNPINQNIIREYDGAGNTVASYTTEPDLYGDVISQHRSGQDSYYHTDAQGSTLALTDSNGDVTDSYAYSAFGETTAVTGSTINPFQYVGQKGYYRDEKTGEYEVRKRPLRALYGRWLATDPLSRDTAYYIYVTNSPLFSEDPSGESALIPLIVEGGRGFITCQSCTAYRVHWQYKVPTRKEVESFHVVQHVTISEWRNYCPPDCSGGCRDVMGSTCALDIWEYLGVIKVAKFGKLFLSTDVADHWDQPTLVGTGKGCEIYGEDLKIAQVRAFSFKDDKLPDPSMTVGWNMEGFVKCGYDWMTQKDEKIYVSQHTFTRPIWWDNFKYETQVRMRHSYDCCKKDGESDLFVSWGSGASYKSDTIQNCMKSKL